MDLGIAVWLTDESVGVVELAPALEAAGVESLFLVGHTHVPTSRRDVLEGDRPGEDARLLDQFTALGAAAACTSTLRLGTGFCVVPQFDPIVLATQVATIDHLSGGRFLFGVGAGWLVEEIRNHGVDPATRWERMEEQLLAMQAIWRDDEAEFHGRFVAFDPIWCWPKPVQRPHPPILVGGEAPRSLRLAACYGDAWAPVVEELDALERGLGRWRELRHEAGVPGGEVCAFVEKLDRDMRDGLDGLGVSRVVVNLTLDARWRSRLDEVLEVRRG